MNRTTCWIACLACARWRRSRILAQPTNKLAGLDTSSTQAVISVCHRAAPARPYGRARPLSGCILDRCAGQTTAWCPAFAPTRAEELAHHTSVYIFLASTMASHGPRGSSVYAVGVSNAAYRRGTKLQICSPSTIWGDIIKHATSARTRVALGYAELMFRSLTLNSACKALRCTQTNCPTGTGAEAALSSRTCHALYRLLRGLLCLHQARAFRQSLRIAAYMHFCIETVP